MQGDINSKAKFHISLGHETVMATITLLGRADQVHPNDRDSFSWESEYKVVACISADKEEEEAKAGTPEQASLALLEFERPVVAVPDCKGTKKPTYCKDSPHESLFSFFIFSAGFQVGHGHP